MEVQESQELQVHQVAQAHLVLQELAVHLVVQEQQGIVVKVLLLVLVDLQVQ